LPLPRPDCALPRDEDACGAAAAAAAAPAVVREPAPPLASATTLLASWETSGPSTSSPSRCALPSNLPDATSDPRAYNRYSSVIESPAFTTAFSVAGSDVRSSALAFGSGLSAALGLCGMIIDILPFIVMLRPVDTRV